MKYVKKYEDGGRRPKKKKEPRRNIAYTSPRTLPSSQMVGEGVMERPEEKKKKKKKVKKSRGRAGVTQGTRRMLQRAVDISCRKPSTC
jgi:hypothetical protein